MILFNNGERQLRLSVNDLVHAAVWPFDETDAVFSPRRARMGQDVHTRYLNAQDPACYRKEIPVRWEGRVGDFAVVVEGRADGCRQTDRGIEVEEIKSTLRSGYLLSEMQLNPAHAEQCGFYCLFLSLMGMEIAGGAVKYLPIGDGAARIFEIHFMPDEWTVRFQTRVLQILAQRQQLARQADKRRSYAAQLVFPFHEERAGQKAMMEEVTRTLEDGVPLMCAAPTGIGKTAAALYPALRIALERDALLVYATAKVSQQELAMDTLRRMIRPGCGVLALQITARERACPMDELRCMVDQCPLGQQLEQRLARCDLPAQALAAGTVDQEMIRKLALENHLCPFETALFLADQASVIVADYNYVFDPAIRLRGLIDEAARPLYLIVDEAHNLPARVTGYYSPEVDLRRMDILRGACAMADPPVYTTLKGILDDALRFFREGLARLEEEQGAAPSYVEPPNPAFFRQTQNEWDLALYAYFMFLAQDGMRPTALAPVREKGRKRLDDPLLTILLQLQNFAECAQRDPERFAGIWYTAGRVKLLCLDPAPMIAESLARFNGVVLMSATLHPFDFYSTLLGLEPERFRQLDLPSPFPRENRLFLTVPRVDTTYKKRSGAAVEIAQILVETLALKPGNYLAFFASFAYRDEVLAHLPDGPFRIIRQEPAMPTDPILRELLENRTETVLLCAVQGGVFSEGVDYPGHLAIGAFIIGPALPQVGPEQNLIKAYFDRQREAGFEYAYVNPGMNRVIQSGGRVIRTPEDQGFVMLICRRFTNRMYANRFPAYWSEEMQVAEDPVPAIRAFWDRAGGVAPEGEGPKTDEGIRKTKGRRRKVPGGKGKTEGPSKETE
jgi:DNA excision repair protein ERCC-2